MLSILAVRFFFARDIWKIQEHNPLKTFLIVQSKTVLKHNVRNLIFVPLIYFEILVYQKRHCH